MRQIPERLKSIAALTTEVYILEILIEKTPTKSFKKFLRRKQKAKYLVLEDRQKKELSDSDKDFILSAIDISSKVANEQRLGYENEFVKACLHRRPTHQ
jgi:hypothetical protein